MRIFSLAAALLILAAPSHAKADVNDAVKELAAVSGDEQLRLIRALGRRRQAKAAPALLQLFNPREDNPRRSAAIAEALGRLRESSATDALLAAWDYLIGLRSQTDLTAQVQVFRLAVVEALGEIGGDPAFRVLSEALAEPEPAVVERAIRGFARMRERKAVTALIELSARGGNIGQAACEALGRIGDPKAEPALQVALKSPDPLDRVAAAYGLALLGRREGVELLDAFVGTQESGENPRLGEKLRLFSAYFLARLDRKAGLDYLASMVKSGSDSQRKILAAEALGKSDNPRAAAILIGALPSADADLKLIVARGLGKLGGARSIRALKKMSQDSDPESRAAVDAALMELGEK